MRRQVNGVVRSYRTCDSWIHCSVGRSLMPGDFPLIATGSIVRLTVPGGRSTDGEPCQIPAIVLGQFPEDGTLKLFCFHFEGQFLQTSPAKDVEVLFDAGGRAL